MLLGWIWVLIHPRAKLVFVCCDGESAWFTLSIITALGIILLRRDDRDIFTLGIMSGEGEREIKAFLAGRRIISSKA